MFNKNEMQRMYRYAYSLVRDEPEAFDLLQESLEAVIKRSTSQTIEQPLAYAMKTIRNRFFNKIKSSYWTQSHNQQVIDENLSIEDLSIEVDQKIEVEKILSWCNPEEREILFLWAYEGMSYEEIAIHTSISKGSLLSRIHRLKKRILRRLREDDHD